MSSLVAILKKAFLNYRQLIVYCLIGGSGASLDFLVYCVLLKATSLHHQAANAAGYTCGTVLSFILNARFNFKTRSWLLLRFLSFCGVGVLGWGVSAGSLFLLVDWLGVNRYAAKLATIVGVVLVQYNLNRLVSFRKTPPAAYG